MGFFMDRTNDESTVLAGDIGGTKANIGLFSVRGNDIQPVCEKSFICKNYAGLEPILKEFLTISNKNIIAASFGVAGTIHKGRVHSRQSTLDDRNKRTPETS